MAVLKDVIFPWYGNHASIPSGWTRVTDLDSKMPKAWGIENPNTTGGADTHAHIGIEHSHARGDTHGHLVAYNYTNAVGDDIQGPNRDPHPEPNHKHDDATITTSSDGAATSTVAYPSASNLPPYNTVIFLKAAIGASLKENHIAYSNVNEIPVGWYAMNGANGTPDMRNRYIRGAATGANAGDTGGAFTHTHDLAHSHATSHTHSGNSGGATNMRTIDNSGSGSWRIGGHNHLTHLNATTVNTDAYSGSVTSESMEPVYYKLLGLLNSGTGALKKGMIALYLDDNTSLPVGWKLCDGRKWTDGLHNTPDLRNKFIKIANDGTEIGNTGGSNTHAHAASNSHTHTQAAAHSHTGYTDVIYRSATQDSTGGIRTPDNHSHSLASVGNNNATMTWGAATMAGESVDNQPAYRTVSYIQCEKVGGSAAILLTLLENE